MLLNDYDPNGDVLVIDSFDQLDASQGRIDLINRNQELQITLPATASGELDFGYTISDGRGGTASATVHVTVRTPEENSPPEQVRTTRTTVEQGGRISTQVIGDWVDPDGDPFYLTSATSTSRPASTPRSCTPSSPGRMRRYCSRSRPTSGCWRSSPVPRRASASRTGRRSSPLCRCPRPSPAGTSPAASSPASLSLRAQRSAADLGRALRRLAVQRRSGLVARTGTFRSLTVRTSAGMREA